MCGIVGYIGSKKNCLPLLIKGLKRLEYRGYDSSGVAFLQSKNEELTYFKKSGRISVLEETFSQDDFETSIGIAHTRWATHGEPNDTNAHPHVSQSGKIALIHNGIIENDRVLKEALLKKGVSFYSSTDSEVLVNFIANIYEENDFSLEEAVRIALKNVIGAYAIAVLSVDDPDKLVIARQGSPLVLGLGDQEVFLASDASPFVEYTKKVIYIEEGQVATLSKSGDISIKDIHTDKEHDYYVEQLDWDLAAIEKSGYPHFMLKEIFEQPKAVTDTLRGRLSFDDFSLKLSSIEENEDVFKNAKRIIIIACGTSWHAGLIGEYLLEDVVRIPVEVEYASEFRYRNPVIEPGTILFAISQSGETADTLAALKMAKDDGVFTYGICNVVGSSIARECHAGCYTHAGPEIGVASTKAFTTQVVVLGMLALKIARLQQKINTGLYKELAASLVRIPKKIEEILSLNEDIFRIAKQYTLYDNFLYVARGFNFPVALEGALKLKEISYIHAEGYPAAEMKHGPIALIDDEMPLVIVILKNNHYEKVFSNLQEILSRKGRVIAITNQGNDEVKAIVEDTIEIPHTAEAFTPLLSNIPMQLLAYHIAVLRGKDVDKPRNLAKSVTVE